MAKIKSYKSFFGFKTHKAIRDAFFNSLLSTNRTYDFFVDCISKFIHGSFIEIDENNLEDLKHKIRYYLDHENKARVIFENAKKTVLERHTYKHRLEELFSNVKAISANSSFSNICKKGLKKNRSPQLPQFLNSVFENNIDTNIKNPLQYREVSNG